MKDTALGAIVRDVGLMLHAPVLIAVPLALWMLVAGQGTSATIFGVTAVVATTVGQGLFRWCRDCDVASRVHALAVAALAWLGVVGLGCLPLLLSGLSSPTSSATRIFAEVENALFESMSGFTSTGLTVVSDPSALPPALLLWRSLSEWLGGVGIIVALLAFLNPATDVERLFSAERARRSRASVRDVLTRTWWIYGLYTTGAIGVFWLLGMPAWEALNHGLTGISTGGFTVTADGMSSYDLPLRVATMVVMVLGAISFYTHARILRAGEVSALWKDANARLFFTILGVGFLFVLVERGEWAWHETLYQWVSALTTSGFSTVDLTTWRPPALLALTVAMTVGGVSGATAGGLKVNRVFDLMQGIRIRFQRIWSEDDDEPDYRFGESVLESGEAHRRVEAAAVLAVLWVVSILAGTLSLRAFVGETHSIVAVLFEATSALSGVGLSAGVVSADLATGGKLVLMGLMWLGRLEIIPVLVLVLLPFRGARPQSPETSG